MSDDLCHGGFVCPNAETCTLRCTPQVPRPEKVDEPVSNFKVGDRVEHVENAPGYIGTIKALSSALAMIKWDKSPEDPDWVQLKFLTTAGDAAKDATDPAYYVFSNGAQVKDISENLTGNGAQIVQYVARATRFDGNVKGNPLEDLRKARRFLDWEIERLERTS